MKYPEYRILHDQSVRIYDALARHQIPCFFFEFNESESDFNIMCRHLITSHRTYHGERVSFQGQINISDNLISIFNPGSSLPYITLEKDQDTGQFSVVHSPKPGINRKDREENSLAGIGAGSSVEKS